MRTIPTPDPARRRISRSRRVLPLAFGALLTLASGAQANSYSAQYLAPFAVPAAMNQQGAVVGWNPVWNTAFVFDDVAGYVELPCLKGFSTCRAVDINEAGWIVGHAEGYGLLELRRAMIWKPAFPGYKIELPIALAGPASLRTPGINSSEAVAIDNSNRVIGGASSVTLSAREVSSWIFCAMGRNKKPTTNTIAPTPTNSTDACSTKPRTLERRCSSASSSWRSSRRTSTSST